MGSHRSNLFFYMPLRLHDAFHPAHKTSRLKIDRNAFYHPMSLTLTSNSQFGMEVAVNLHWGTSSSEVPYQIIKLSRWIRRSGRQRDSRVELDGTGLLRCPSYWSFALFDETVCSVRKLWHQCLSATATYTPWNTPAMIFNSNPFLQQQPNTLNSVNATLSTGYLTNRKMQKTGTNVTVLT